MRRLRVTIRESRNGYAGYDGYAGLERRKNVCVLYIFGYLQKSVTSVTSVTAACCLGG